MARPCFVANWKMNKTVVESLSYLTLLQKHLTDRALQNCDLIIAPPYTALFSMGKRIKELSLPTSWVAGVSPPAGVVPPSLRLSLAAQNIYSEADGPYTGEISAKMLCETGCQYVIIGHSERRNYFSENNNTIAAKVLASLGAGLTPILCVGERAKERKEGRTLEVVKRQVKEGLSRVDGDLSQCIVAYEPVWAIGTGNTPASSEVGQVHQAIAQSLKEKGRDDACGTLRIIYGGSVNEENVAAFMKEPHIDGILIGGASLSAETFVNIVQVGARCNVPLP